MVVLLILTLGLSLVLTSCGQSGSGGSVFNWNVGADPKTIDPGLNGASDGGDVINQTHEGLVREKSGVVYPGIAESWETSADGLTVTFKLRAPLKTSLILKQSSRNTINSKL